MRKFLVTAIGSMSALAVFDSIRKNYPDSVIVGTDIYPKEWVYKSSKTDHFYQVQKATSVDYLSQVMDIVEEHEIDTIIPLTDPEVDVLSLARSHNSRLNKVLKLSEDATIQKCRNKGGFEAIFENTDVHTISEFRKEDLINSKVEFPLVAKPINGRSSEGLIFLNNLNQLPSIQGENYIFQKFIKGTVITVDFVRDSFGGLSYIARKELLRTSNGAGVTVELMGSDTLSKLMYTITETLDIIGAMNLEFIYDGKDYFLMDINPRFSAGVGYNALIGYDFVKNHIDCWDDKRVEKVPEFKTVIASKMYNDYLLS